MALAVRFAPYLIQNTTNLPTRFDTYVENREYFPLHIDTWDITDVEPRLIDSKGINFSALNGAACPDSAPAGVLDEAPLPTTDGTIEDCKLLDDFMTKYSCYEHSQSSEMPVVIPEEPELRQDLEALGRWRDQLIKRRAAVA